MEDLYGVCFSANGDATNPATFYISLSPDYVYLHRFAFKFVIKPFKSSVAGAGGTSLTIGSTELDGVDDRSFIINGTSTIDETGGGVTPNPHTHTASGEITGLTYGVKEIDTASTNWRVVIHGVDITSYLIEQQDGEWINMSGQKEKVFPTNKSLYTEDMYDILDVASVMVAEGNDSQAELLLQPEFKKVQIYSDAPFGIDAYLYLKYSTVNR